MFTTFKTKIIHSFYSIADRTADSTLRILPIYLICLVCVVFFGKFVENGKAFAQEEAPQKCVELIDPNTVEELKELRICLKKLNIERGVGRGSQIIKRSYEGSLNLMEKINMSTDKKSSKKLTEKS